MQLAGVVTATPVHISVYVIQNSINCTPHFCHIHIDFINNCCKFQMLNFGKKNLKYFLKLKIFIFVLYFFLKYTVFIFLFLKLWFIYKTKFFIGVVPLNKDWSAFTGTYFIYVILCILRKNVCQINTFFDSLSI